MRINSDTANKLVKQYNAEIAQILLGEENNKTYSHAVNETPFKPEYNFRETREQVAALQEKVLKIRHAVAKFNVKTKLPEFGVTLDEAIGMMSNLNAQKKRLESMLTIPEKQRKMGFGSKEADFVCRNFDAAEVREEYEKTCKELMQIQQAINVANLTKEFEVDI